MSYWYHILYWFLTQYCFCFITARPIPPPQSNSHTPKVLGRSAVGSEESSRRELIQHHNLETRCLRS